MQFTPEKPKTPEISQIEKDLNEIIPILAHGLVRRIERKDFSGKVRVQAIAGDAWGVAKSPDNLTDVPNVIIYPRESLSGDLRLVNARLRHEIGNINYPIDAELNALRSWCHENKVAPELLTSLVEATHEASVNFLEMRNSHSSNPEENFRALYEQEINTQQIADNIPQYAPYKQVVDLTLLYSLSQTGLVPAEQFEQALSVAHPAVQEVFDKQTRSILDQSVRMAVPKAQVQLVRDFLWPKFSSLVALSGPAESDKGKAETGEDLNTHSKQKELSPEAQVRAEKAKELQKKIQQMMQKMHQQAKDSKKPSLEKPDKQKKESPKRQEQQLSPAEKQERKEEEDLLAQNLQEQLQQAREKFERLQKSDAKPEAPKPQEKPSSMQDIGKQAEQMRQEAEKAMQEAQESGVQDEVTEEQLQQLKEQLEQLEEVAKQIAESGALEEELAKPEEEPIVYNIKEMQEQLQQMREKLGEMRDQASGESEDQETKDQKSEKQRQQQGEQSSEKSDTQQAESSKQPTQSGEKHQNAEQKSDEQEQAGQEQQSSEQGSEKLSAQELQKQIEELKEQVNDMTKDAEERGDQVMADQLKEMKEQLEEMAEKLEQGEQGEKQGEDGGEESEGESGQPGSSGQGQGGGEELGEGEGLGEGGQEQSQGGQPRKGMGQSKGAGQSGGQGGEMGGEGGESGGLESGNDGMPSAQEMQEFLQQIQDVLNQAKGQGGSGQEVTDQLLEQLSQMQESLESGATPQEMTRQMQDMMRKLSEAMFDMQGKEQGEDQGEGQPSEQSGESSGPESSESGGESVSEQSHEQFQQGGKTHKGPVESLFGKPNENLLEQLRQSEEMIGSKFSTKDESGNLVARDMSQNIRDRLQNETSAIDQSQAHQLETLDELKRQQQTKMEAVYREMSGLDGEALRVYVDYMESTKEFITDLTQFFIDKFKLDKEYLRERNQRRGARLQRGFTQNILGQREGTTVISPRSFERKRPPGKPQFAWTLVIDNSGSCGGEIIEQEKKLAVALVEVAKKLDIPFEIVTFGGPNEFTFLKQFEQDMFGDDLQKMVLLRADQGTPDVITLDAACTSMKKYTDRFRRSYNFVYFMTDGKSGGGSIQEVIERHKKDMVITGIGLAEAAQTIGQTWGKNAVEVPDIKKLSDIFIRKVEEQIDSTFD